MLKSPASPNSDLLFSTVDKISQKNVHKTSTMCTDVSGGLKIFPNNIFFIKPQPYIS